MNWNNIIKNVDNWVWLIFAAFCFIIATKYKIPALNAVGGVCLIKAREENGPVPTKRIRNQKVASKPAKVKAKKVKSKPTGISVPK